MIHAAKALLFNSENKILVLKRSDTHPHFANHLDFPGGAVEDGEQAVHAVHREILEETGLSVGIDQLNSVVTKHITQLVLHDVFTCQLQSKEPRITISWEHSEYYWMSIQQLLKYPIPPGVDEYYITVIDYLRTINNTNNITKSNM